MSPATQSLAARLAYGVLAGLVLLVGLAPLGYGGHGARAGSDANAPLACCCAPEGGGSCGGGDERGSGDAGEQWTDPGCGCEATPLPAPAQGAPGPVLAEATGAAGKDSALARQHEAERAVAALPPRDLPRAAPPPRARDGGLPRPALLRGAPGLSALYCTARC